MKHPRLALTLALATTLGATTKAQAYEHQNGMVVNLDSASGKGSTVDPVQNDKLKTMNIKTVRLWASIFGWEREWKGTAYNLNTLITWPGVIDQVRRFKASGYHVVLAVVGDNGIIPQNSYTRADGSVITYEQAVQLQFSHLVEKYALANLVDVWEIGNEPDQPIYWNDGKAQYSRDKVQNYVDKMLVPAAKYLHARGLKVMTGAPSWNPANVADIVARLKATPITSTDTNVTSAFDLVDYVGYHPYRNIQSLENDVKAAKVAAAGKPMIASEWWVVTNKCKDVPQWNENNALGYRIIAKYFAYAHFYTLSPDSNPDGASGCNSVLNLNNTPRIVTGGRGMFEVLSKESLTHYDVADWSGPTGVVKPVPAPTPAPTPVPTPVPAPVPVPTPTVASLDVYDDDTKTYVNHLTTTYSVEIDLATNPLRNIAFTVGLENGKSVKLFYQRFVDGVAAETLAKDDAAEPYSVFGDNGAATNPVLYTMPATVGEHRITATPYSTTIGSTAGATVVYSVVIKDSSAADEPAPVPTPIPAPVPIPKPAPVDGGTYYLKSVGNPIYCTDIYGIAKNAGAILNLWGCRNGAVNQQMHFVAPAGTKGPIKLYSDTMCLDSDSKGRMILNTCNPALPTQNFTFNTANSSIKDDNGKCMDVFQLKYVNGTRIYMWDCNYGNNQRWNRVAK